MVAGDVDVADVVDEPLLQIRLIGPPKVIYGRQSLTHQQQALLAYLAVRGPASSDDLHDALWSGRLMSASRLPNLLAETRAIIGKLLLPHCQDGYYRLSRFDSDLIRLDALASGPGAYSSSTARQVAVHGILGEVRGLALHRSAHAGRLYWTWLEDCYVQRAAAERQVADLALELSNRHQAGNLRQAVWALEQALRVIPHDQMLTEHLAELYVEMGRSSSARMISDRRFAVDQQWGDQQWRRLTRTL